MTPEKIKADIDAARAALWEAERASAAADRRQRAAEIETVEDVRRRFVAERAELAVAANAAREALRQAQSKLPDHPAAGKRVFSMQSVGPRTVWRKPQVRVEGIVEMMRLDTVLPGNTPGYRRPEIGEVFVRLLKPDGSAGKKFQTIRVVDWRLVDDESGEVVQP